MGFRVDFKDRRTAGRALAAALGAYRGSGSQTVVLGLTRSGMAVAAEVAAALQLPLDVLVVHKIAAPAHPAVGLAAVAEPGHVVVNQPAVHQAALSDAWVAEAVAQGISAVSRRARAYRGGRERLDLWGRRVIVVDDSAATGVTLQAAVAAVRAVGAREVILAVPVLPAAAAEMLRPQVDRVVSLATPADLVACDLHYPSPHAVSDDDIRRFLQLETHPHPAARKERGMQQARVALYRVKPGTADEVIRHAEAHLVPAHRNQRGFVAYGLIKSGDAALISLSIWNTAEQAAAAVQIAAAEQEHFAAMIEAVDDYIGDLAFFWDLAAIGR